jgi:arginine deiminase
MKGYPKTIELLNKSECKINLFSGNELCIKAEGGATCLTRPIWRE